MENNRHEEMTTQELTEGLEAAFSQHDLLDTVEEIQKIGLNAVPVRGGKPGDKPTGAAQGKIEKNPAQKKNYQKGEAYSQYRGFAHHRTRDGLIEEFDSLKQCHAIGMAPSTRILMIDADKEAEVAAVKKWLPKSVVDELTINGEFIGTVKTPGTSPKAGEEHKEHIHGWHIYIALPAGFYDEDTMKKGGTRKTVKVDEERGEKFDFKIGEKAGYFLLPPSTRSDYNPATGTHGHYVKTGRVINGETHPELLEKLREELTPKQPTAAQGTPLAGGITPGAGTGEANERVERWKHMRSWESIMADLGWKNVGSTCGGTCFRFHYPQADSAESGTAHSMQCSTHPGVLYVPSSTTQAALGMDGESDCVSKWQVVLHCLYGGDVSRMFQEEQDLEDVPLTNNSAAVPWTPTGDSEQDKRTQLLFGKPSTPKKVSGDSHEKEVENQPEELDEDAWFSLLMDEGNHYPEPIVEDLAESEQPLTHEQPEVVEQPLTHEQPGAVGETQPTKEPTEAQEQGGEDDDEEDEERNQLTGGWNTNTFQGLLAKVNTKLRVYISERQRPIWVRVDDPMKEIGEGKARQFIKVGDRMHGRKQPAQDSWAADIMAALVAQAEELLEKDSDTTAVEEATRFYTPDGKTGKTIVNTWEAKVENPRYLVVDKNGIHEHQGEKENVVFSNQDPGVFEVDTTGSIRDLVSVLQVLNTKPEHLPLILGTMVSPIVDANVERPFLMVKGRRGSGKTTLTEKIKQIMDPSVSGQEQMVDLTTRDTKKVTKTIVGTESFILGNIESISKHMSNELCQVAGGSEIAERALYTNDKILRYSVKSSLIFSTIEEELFLKEDLQSRIFEVVVDSLEGLSGEERDRGVERMKQAEASIPKARYGLLLLASKIKAYFAAGRYEPGALHCSYRWTEVGQILTAMSAVLEEEGFSHEELPDWQDSFEQSQKSLALASVPAFVAWLIENVNVVDGLKAKDLQNQLCGKTAPYLPSEVGLGGTVSSKKISGYLTSSAVAECFVVDVVKARGNVKVFNLRRREQLEDGITITNNGVIFNGETHPARGRGYGNDSRTKGGASSFFESMM